MDESVDLEARIAARKTKKKKKKKSTTEGIGENGEVVRKKKKKKKKKQPVDPIACKLAATKEDMYVDEEAPINSGPEDLDQAPTQDNRDRKNVGGRNHNPNEDKDDGITKIPQDTFSVCYVANAISNKEEMSVDEEAPINSGPEDLDQAPTQDNHDRKNVGGRNHNPHEDKDDGIIKIPEDTFSMFYVANTWWEHVPPIAVYAMQIWVLGLILQNLKTEGGIIEVELMTQVLACFIVVFTSSDFVDGLLFIGRPIIRDDVDTSTTSMVRRAKLSCKWEISNFMRLSEGVLTVCVSFAFIARSLSVVELFQNFAAVAFVSEFDNGFFMLAQRGLFGAASKRATGRVTHCAYHTEKKTCRRFLRYSFFALIPLAMLVALIYLDDIWYDIWYQSQEGSTSEHRSVEGKMSLHLEHGRVNECSACEEHSLSQYDQWFDFTPNICVPFPREPLLFQKGPFKWKAQVGLLLNETHFSVRAASGMNLNYDSTYHNETNVAHASQNDNACQQVFSPEGGSYVEELLSFKRDNTLEKRERIHLNFAVLLDQNRNSSVVNSEGVECLFTSSIKEEDCNGSKPNSLSQKYYDHSLEKSHLSRAWFVFDMKVMAELLG